MDATYFLKERTRLIRYLYADGAKSFALTQQQIEDELPPYDDPPYSEDPEPPYLNEWLQAATARDVLAIFCISLLSDTVKLYLETLRSRVIGFTFKDPQPFKEGFVAAYKEVLGHILDTDWSDCPADFGIIEQVVLARNRGQHGESLLTLDVTHDRRTLQKYPRPFFVSDEERDTWERIGGSPDSFLAPSIKISPETLSAAIDHVEKLADWIDSRLDRAWAWRERAGPGS
jgi:hypothetical protein